MLQILPFFPTAAQRTPRSWFSTQSVSEVSPCKMFHHSGVGVLTTPVSAKGFVPSFNPRVLLSYLLSWCSSSTRTRATYRQRTLAERHQIFEAVPVPIHHGLIKAARTLDLLDYGHKPCCLWGRGGEAMYMPTAGG
jgi:hypothetical protein